MGIAAAQHLRGWLGRWDNPILLKEMRCSSRRKRFYLLRALYVAAVTLFVMLVWIAQERTAGMYATSGRYGGVAMAARMADIGKHVIYSIAWFQYIAAQLVAVLLLSNAVNGEIQKRTYGVLLTTPVSYFQIALGKTVGGIQHVIILLLCSLPLLTLVRVMGGVPWDFIVRTLAIALSAAFLAAAFSLHFSILFRQPYAVMIMAMLSLAAYHLFGWLLWPVGAAIVLLWLLEWCIGYKRTWRPGYKALGTLLVIFSVIGFYALWIISGKFEFGAVFNPTLSMVLCGESILDPGAPPLADGYVVAGVLVTVACAFFLLLRSSRRLAGIAFTKAWGDQAASGGKMDLVTAGVALADMTARPIVRPEREVAAIMAQVSPSRATDVLYGKCERWGSPVVWKDLRGAMVRSDIVRFFIIFLPVGLACVMYFAMLISGSYAHIETHEAIVVVGVLLAAFLTAILAGMTISTERQARTWPILQTIALSDWHILRAKALGVILRVLPVWIVLLGHVILFVLLGQIHPIAIIFVAIMAIWISVFLCGSGFLISTYVRQTTAAAGATLGLAAVLWLLVPMLSLLVVQAHVFGGVSGNAAMLDLGLMSPLSQAAVLVRGSPGMMSVDWHYIYYDINPYRSTHASWQDAIALSLVSLAGYGGAGALMAWLASRRFRKHSF